MADPGILKRGGTTGVDPGLNVGGGAKYTARANAREILCATPTFDVIFKVPAGHTASVGISKRETQQRLTIICA